MPRMTERDKRALLLLAPAVLISLAVYFWPAQEAGVVAPRMTVTRAEGRLTQVRQRVADAPGRIEAAGKLEKELEQREKSLITAQTLPQAQAQLLQIVRRVATAQQPPLVFRTSDFSPARELDGQYGVVTITLSMEAGIEQIVNFLADIGNQPESLGTAEITLGTANPKSKTIATRIAVQGLVDRKLIPVRKEARF